ncbi:MAG: cadherin repeat domain-containing protein, partial [Planctomycetia bacterium]
TRASFLRYDSTDSQVPVLWESDGTAAGTKPTVFSGGSGPSVWLLSKPVGDTLYVAASDPARGSELWALKQVNNAPSAVSLSASSVAENLPAGTVVGTFSTTDPDAGDTFTYSILPDATLDGTTRFTIVGNELRTTGGFDFESKASFRVRVRSTDQGGLFVGRVLTITVSNVNEAPTALALSAMSVAENLPSGAVVGTFSTTDPDVGNTFKYTIVPDLTLDGTGRFAIVGNELRTTGSFDFEAKSSYRLRVRSTDQNGLFVARVLTINVTNVNEAPIAIALTSTSVPGNRPVGTVVGTFSTTDPDAGNTFTYIIVPVSTLDGTSQFEIVGNQLRTKASFNPAVKSSYTLRVRSTDQSGLFTARLITITVTP